MKEATKQVAKIILDKNNHPTQGKTQPMTEAMLEYINASKSGIPSLIVELNRRDGKSHPHVSHTLEVCPTCKASAPHWTNRRAW